MIDYHAYNAKNHYGLSFRELQYWAKRHEKAVKCNDVQTQRWIENMLTDINFHYECSLFKSGEYQKALAEF